MGIPADGHLGGVGVQQTAMARRGADGEGQLGGPPRRPRVIGKWHKDRPVPAARVRGRPQRALQPTKRQKKKRKKRKKASKKARNRRKGKRKKRKREKDEKKKGKKGKEKGKKGEEKKRKEETRS